MLDISKRPMGQKEIWSQKAWFGQVMGRGSPDDDGKGSSLVLISLLDLGGALASNWKSDVLGLLPLKDIVLKSVRMPSGLMLKLRIVF